MDQHDETNKQVAAYRIGDDADPDDIAKFRSTEENCIALSRLQPNDPCFILRSGGRITFARVVEHDEVLVVQVSGDGATKSIPLISCVKYIRLLRQTAVHQEKRPERHSAPDLAFDGEMAESEGLGQSVGPTSRSNRHKHSMRASVDAPPTGSSRRPSRRATVDHGSGRNSSRLHASFQSGLKLNTGKEEKIFRRSTTSDGDGSISIEDLDEEIESLRPQRRSSKTSSRPTLERRSSCSSTLGQPAPASKNNLYASFQSGLNRPAQKTSQRLERLEPITSEIDEFDLKEEGEDLFEEEICLPKIAIDEETKEVPGGDTNSIPADLGHGSSTSLLDTDELSLFEIVDDRRSSRKKNASTVAHKPIKPTKKKNPIKDDNRVSQESISRQSKELSKKPHAPASDDDSNAAVDDGFDTRNQRRRKGKKSVGKTKSTRKKAASSSHKVVKDPDGKPSRKDGQSKGEIPSARSSATQSSGEGSASPNSVMDEVAADLDSWRPLPIPGFKVKLNERSLMSAFNEIGYKPK